MDYASKTVVETLSCGRFVRYNHMLGRGASKEVYLGFDHDQNIQVAWNRIVFREEEVTNITRSLKEYLEKNRSRVQSTDIKNWGKQILEALKFLHTRSPKIIIHRDIKCVDIFVHGDGKQVKLGDFGVAIRVNKGGFAKEFRSTPHSMAPEYFREEYNEFVDIYAFGMCLLEMVTGEHPYKQCSTKSMFNKVITGVKPVALGKVKDSRVKNIIEKCLRPMSVRPSAEELAEGPVLFI